MTITKQFTKGQILLNLKHTEYISEITRRTTAEETSYGVIALCLQIKIKILIKNQLSKQLQGEGLGKQGL